MRGESDMSEDFMKKTFRRIVSVILVLAMVFLGLPEYVSPVKTAKAASGTEVHYLAVASDRHETTDAIGKAFGGMPSSVEYVCLAGDMVTNGAYNTSTLRTEVQNAGLTDATVHVLYAGHDTSVNDDAGILQCKTKSGLMYTGYNEDGSVAYYVYGVSYDSVYHTATVDTTAT